MRDTPLPPDAPSPSVHPSQLPSEQLHADCDLTHTRGSGPGGQHRNKVQTAIRLTHRSTGISAQASERRSQAANLSAALFRLRVTLAIEHRTAAIAPSPLWRSRTRKGKIACNTSHADYPAMLAEAMNHAIAQNGDVKKAALVLEVSSTQLIRFLATEPRALATVNALRTKRGLHALRA